MRDDGGRRRPTVDMARVAPSMDVQLHRSFTFADDDLLATFLGGQRRTPALAVRVDRLHAGVATPTAALTLHCSSLGDAGKLRTSNLSAANMYIQSQGYAVTPQTRWSRCPCTGGWRRRWRGIGRTLA